jgi:RNase P subunit RPR2
MYSTKCPHCRQLITMKNEEVRAAVEQTEAEKKKHFETHCFKCGKLMKIQVSELKRRLPPVPVETSATENPASEESASE